MELNYIPQPSNPTSTFGGRQTPEVEIWRLLDSLLRIDSPREQTFRVDMTNTSSGIWQDSLKVSDEPQAITALIAAGLSIVAFAVFLTASLWQVSFWVVWIPGMLGCIGLFGASDIFANNVSANYVKSARRKMG